ncbi:MAG: nucleotidyltransferase family protein, partial [Caulobacteraceae bacterium]
MNVEGIILAAGFSKRAGVFKLTLELQGKTVIERCIDSMHAACSRIIVVTGYRQDLLVPYIRKYSNTEMVYNMDYADGMYSSIKAGVKHVSGDCFFMIPGDYPAIKCDTYKRMLCADGDIIIPLYEGRKGHPVLISRRNISGILTNDQCSSLSQYISLKGFTPVETDDPGILMDIDYIWDCMYVNS